MHRFTWLRIVRLDEEVRIFLKKRRDAILTSDALHVPLGTTPNTDPPYRLDEPAPTCETCPSANTPIT